MSRTGQHGFSYLWTEIARGAGFQRHQHDAHQFLVVEVGTLVVSTDRDRWAVPARAGVWLDSRLEHELVSLADTAAAFVYIDPKAVGATPATGVVIIRPLLREIVTVLTRANSGSPVRRAHLEAVLVDEIAAMESETLFVPVPVDVAAREVAQELLSSPSNDRSLEKLARNAGTSMRTLQRRFLEETGLSFQAWRRRARVQVAMSLLGDGASVTAASIACGFSSPSAFITAFRQEVGTTPAAWCRSLAHR